MSHIRRIDGRLYIEDVAASDVADAFGTPTFVYSASHIVDAYQQFEAAFAGVETMICYAVKANSNLGVLGLLAGLGAGFDIVSVGELERVLRAGGDPGRVVFSGVGKQDHEIARALDAGIACFNVESASELHRIDRIATGMGKQAPISIRINPDVDAETHPYISTGLKENKFGVTIEAALTLYEAVAALPSISIQGVDCHIGSQITSVSPFAEAIARVGDFVDDLARRGIELRHIDLGGGIGVRYQDEPLIDIDEYASTVRQILSGRPQSLVFEPGRLLVANAGVLLCRTVTLKENEGKHFAVVDAAMNDLIRPALYQAWQDIVRVEPAVGEARQFDIVGPICESGDFLGKHRDLVLAEGDLLAVQSAGAYGFVMSSNYNSRGRAAEVMVKGSAMQCVRQRETIDDQLRLESTFKG